MLGFFIVEAGPAAQGGRISLALVLYQCKQPGLV